MRRCWSGSCVPRQGQADLPDRRRDSRRITPERPDTYGCGSPSAGHDHRDSCHYDHTQGIPNLRRAASKEGQEIEVYASQKAIPLLADAVSTLEAWWQLFEENTDRLDDTDYLAEAVLSEIQPTIPNLAVLSPTLRIILGLVTTTSRLVRRDPPVVGEILLREIAAMLADGYRTSKGL